MAVESIGYLRTVEPREPVVLFTDSDQENQLTGPLRELDVQVEILEGAQFSFVDKIDGISRSPFAKTIFLDSDTFPIRPFASDMYRALDFCELLALGGVGLNHAWEETRFSPAISQYNTGVLGLSAHATSAFVPEWGRIYRSEENPKHDQSSFRAAVLESGVRCAPLPPAFNYMGHGSVARARILHFTGARRAQAFYKSPRARERLIHEFATAEAPGFFAHFAPASSAHAVLGRNAGGRLSWWFGGIGHWFFARLRRLLREAFRTASRRG